MPDFYSPMLTENADGTQTSHHSRGNSNLFGLTVKLHRAHIKFPAGRVLAVGDKIVIASVPTDLKPMDIYFTTTRGVGLPGTPVVKSGIFKFNDDGTVGNKVSANSDILFGATTSLAAYHSASHPRMLAGVLDSYDRGKQLWQMVNIRDPGTYTENPGGMFCYALEVSTGTTTVAGDELMIQIEYASAGN